MLQCGDIAAIFLQTASMSARLRRLTLRRQKRDTGQLRRHVRRVRTSRRASSAPASPADGAARTLRSSPRRALVRRDCPRWHERSPRRPGRRVGAKQHASAVPPLRRRRASKARSTAAGAASRALGDAAQDFRVVGPRATSALDGPENSSAARLSDWMGAPADLREPSRRGEEGEEDFKRLITPTYARSAPRPAVPSPTDVSTRVSSGSADPTSSTSPSRPATACRRETPRRTSPTIERRSASLMS